MAEDIYKKGCIYKELFPGDTGTCVLLAQKILKRYGVYAKEPNGKFDYYMEQAVRKFQKLHKEYGLEETGLVDQATWGVLLWYATPEEKCWIVPYLEECRQRAENLQTLLLVLGILGGVYLMSRRR